MVWKTSVYEVVNSDQFVVLGKAIMWTRCLTKRHRPLFFWLKTYQNTLCEVAACVLSQHHSQALVSALFPGAKIPRLNRWGSNSWSISAFLRTWRRGNTLRDIGRSLIYRDAITFINAWLIKWLLCFNLILPLSNYHYTHVHRSGLLSAMDLQNAALWLFLCCFHSTLWCWFSVFALASSWKETFTFSFLQLVLFENSERVDGWSLPKRTSSVTFYILPSPCCCSAYSHTHRHTHTYTRYI